MSVRAQHPSGTRVYLSGPMTGVMHHNYPAFDVLARDLRERDGFIVYNPAENFGGKIGLPRKEYMRVDLVHLLQAEILILLPGWETSKGAQLEVAIAKELGLPCWAEVSEGRFTDYEFQEMPVNA